MATVHPTEIPWHMACEPTSTFNGLRCMFECCYNVLCSKPVSSVWVTGSSADLASQIQPRQPPQLFQVKSMTPRVPVLPISKAVTSQHPQASNLLANPSPLNDHKLRPPYPTVVVPCRPRHH